MGRNEVCSGSSPFVEPNTGKQFNLNIELFRPRTVDHDQIAELKRTPYHVHFRYHFRAIVPPSGAFCEGIRVRCAVRL